MRALNCLASIGAAIVLAVTALSASPAAAFDDSLPHYAPYRAHYGHAPYRAHRGYTHEHCRRLTWRERCRPYKLGGYFARNVDFRRVPWFR